jgi:hypothetical protein
MSDAWLGGVVFALALMCLVINLRLTKVAQSVQSNDSIERGLSEVQAIAAKARAVAITAQARIESMSQDSEGLKMSSDSLRETHAQIRRDIEQALALKTELAVFVEHGDKVIDRLNNLINGMGGKR